MSARQMVRLSGRTLADRRVDGHDLNTDPIASGIAEFLEGGMVVRWVLIGECLDEEGNREPLYLWPDGQSEIDNLGLLAYATTRQQAVVVDDVIMFEPEEGECDDDCGT